MGRNGEDVEAQSPLERKGEKCFKMQFLLFQTIFKQPLLLLLFRIH